MTEEELKILPSLDGVTHINVYTKGATKLGKMLTNLAHTPFDHPEYGHFESVEAYWYWAKTGKQFDELKLLHEYQSKKQGQEKAEEIGMDKTDKTDKDNIPDDFKEEIKKALQYKIKQNKDVLAELTKSTLPLKHYYYYGKPDNAKVYLLDEYEWIIDELERLRSLLHEVVEKKKKKKKMVM